MPIYYRNLFFVVILFLSISAFIQSSAKMLSFSNRIVGSSKLPRVLKFRFTMPDGSWVQATEPENGQIVITGKDTRFLLSPHIINENLVAVTIRFGRTSAANCDESVFMEESIKMEMNKAYSPSMNLVSIGFPQTITIQEAERESEARRPSEKASRSNRNKNRNNRRGNANRDNEGSPPSIDSSESTQERCCIVCNGRTICACSVTTGCGSCCQGLCCN